jgi:heptosyltransferase-2
MTTPALIRLRERFPRARITLLTPRKLLDLWTGQPMLDEAIGFDRIDSVWRTARRLRAGGFDLALALPNSHRSALELWLAGIPRRVGRAVPFRSWMLTRALESRPGMIRMSKRSPAEALRLCRDHAPPGPPPAPTTHQIHDYLHLVAALGADPNPVPPQLEVPDQEIRKLRDRFGISRETPWLGLNPGAEYGPAKRWPAERFAAAACELQRRLDCRWILLGGPGDVELVRDLEAMILRGLAGRAARDGPVAMAGRTSLRELAAVFRCCRLLLSNDTGPAHLAAALGIPVVVPFGSTSPELTAPGLPGDPRHRFLRRPVSCSPCFLRECPVDHRCMTGIEVKEVVAVVQDLLGAERQSPLSE